MSDPIRIDLSSPEARRLLSGTNTSSARTLATGKRDVVRIAGDVPDPTRLTDRRGVQSTTDLSSGKHEVLVLFGDLVMTVDIYQVPGEPLVAHLYCPRCHKHATVRGDHKAIAYDPADRNPMRSQIAALGKLPPEIGAALGAGRISIETFECPWEIGDDRHAPGALHTGVSLCRMRIAIEDNRAREA